MKRKYIYIAIFLFVAFSVIRKIMVIKKAEKELKNSVIVTAVITDIDGGRGAFGVHVRYMYNGKILNSEFNTYNLDSLHQFVKIRLRISKNYPDKYIAYVGVDQ
jgi:hypothetical protein